MQIDSLDMLALLGDRERFASSVEWIGKNLQFDIVSNDLYLHIDILSTPCCNSFTMDVMELNVRTLYSRRIGLANLDLQISFITCKHLDDEIDFHFRIGVILILRYHLH